MESITIRQVSFSDSILSRLDTRDIALWVDKGAIKTTDPVILADVIRLPWRAVLLEEGDPTLEAAILAQEDPTDSKVLRRGHPVIIEHHPANVLLPPRNLPIYKPGNVDESSTMKEQLSRLSILNELKQANPSEMLVLSSEATSIPADLRTLWEEGFRPLVTIVGDQETLFAKADEWRRIRTAGGSIAVIQKDITGCAKELSIRYAQAHIAERVFIRIRNARGNISPIDVTRVDDVQYPLLGRYEFIQDKDLRPLMPKDLTAETVEEFFRDPSASWQPYAAGLPWPRDEGAWNKLHHILQRLDRNGSDANTVAFVRTEAGAGGTTLARMLAWRAAADGYPTLFAKGVPFKPASLEIVNFMTRTIDTKKQSRKESDDGRLYEAPWLIVFDRDHWEGRDSDLRSFLQELMQSGRVACILVITGPYASIDFMSRPCFKEIDQLTHEVPQVDAMAFGRHLNRYLEPHGPVRKPEEWENFFHSSAVHAKDGISSFWVTLSFWLQRQIDMNETVQSWLFQQFQKSVKDPQLRSTLVDIAAITTERRPFPESMLPTTIDWPVTQKLQDLRTTIGALGLIRLQLEGDRYWALAHDILGRYLLRAIYHNPSTREELGFGDASNIEHLRFLALRRISSNPAIGNIPNREIAEDFAVNIFKIDPDHGHSTFVPYWREALAALDAMPTLLWQTSRALRHHSAISRRRIAKDKGLFNLPDNERLELLHRAIKDIQFALKIPRTEGEESDLNLYNSLARAYQDLHTVAAEAGKTADDLKHLRKLATDATRRAFQLNPDSPFVVETYAQNLLEEAKANPLKAAENALEVMNLIYLEMERDRSAQRRYGLSRLAESAIETLLVSKKKHQVSNNPEIALLIDAIDALTQGVSNLTGMELGDFPVKNRLNAAQILSGTDVRSNLQAVRMLYTLTCLDSPKAFKIQLSLLEELMSGAYPNSPQQRLELAVLLHQCGRYEDAENLFKQLRPLWRTKEFFVQVPDRLRWLLDANANNRLQVTAHITTEGEGRGFANIREMRNLSVPFRALEFGQKLRPGAQIKGYVSFAHNGPFLRPLMAVMR